VSLFWKAAAVLTNEQWAVLEPLMEAWSVVHGWAQLALRG
jgi:hypothetical protein